MKLRLGRKPRFSIEDIEREAAAEIEQRVAMGRPAPEEWKGLADYEPVELRLRADQRAAEAAQAAEAEAPEPAEPEPRGKKAPAAKKATTRKKAPAPRKAGAKKAPAARRTS
jgi:hypothetical protein